MRFCVMCLPSLIETSLSLCQAQLPLPHHYLLVVRSHEVTVAKATTGKKRRRKGKAAASEEDPLVNGARHNDLVFDYFENEIFQKVACILGKFTDLSVYWYTCC